MSDPGTESDSTDGEGDDADFDRTVERAFTCSLCGFATVHEVGLLRAEVQSVCVNCGDWTVQTAALEDLVEPAREAAAMLDGPILTERQALAYVLRDVVGVDREAAAEVMDSTPSNVDNLRRRGAEKVEAAEAVVAGLDALLAPDGDVVEPGEMLAESDAGDRSEAGGEFGAGDDRP